MTTIQEQNKALILQYLDEVWSKGNIAAADDFLSPAYKRYLSPISEPLSLDGQKQRLAGFRAAFPDVQITAEDMLAEGDRVVFAPSCAAHIREHSRESCQRGCR